MQRLKKRAFSPAVFESRLELEREPATSGTPRQSDLRDKLRFGPLDAVSDNLARLQLQRQPQLALDTELDTVPLLLVDFVLASALVFVVAVELVAVVG